MSTIAWAEVIAAARGDRSDYQQESRPLAPAGGQGEVYKATHKATGVEVAIKRLRDTSITGYARMAREIDVAAVLAGHPNVMPVLDAASTSEWFVMPLAQGSAADRLHDLRDDAPLRSLVDSVCDGLAAAHTAGWVHRDIKPANILDLDGTWVVADWGLGRRPRGETTVEGRTKIGVFIGTERFSAPELADDAHEASFAADVYSVGQLVGWAVTGELPRPFQPLIPPSGAWRGVVKAATQLDPAKRPQTIAQLVDLIAVELDEPPLDPAGIADSLLERAQAGSRSAAAELWKLAGAHPHDYDLFTEVIARVPAATVQELTRAEPSVTGDIVRAMGGHQDGSFGRSLSFTTANMIVRLLLAVAREAATAGWWDLLEDAADAMFTWDAAWDQWNARDAVAAWLAKVDGDAARVVSASLRRCAATQHFDALTENRSVDPRIRAAIATS